MRKPLDETSVLYLAKALAALRTSEEADAFLRDLCTVRELDELARRLRVARLLARGCTYSQIQALTGVSSTTVSRVSRTLGQNGSAYRTVIARIEDEDA